MNKRISSVEKLMQKMNASAHEIASMFEKKLDYTDKSVRTVESILGELHREYKKTKDDSGLRGIALFFAAYLGEVIRRKGLDGSWRRNHSVWGKNSFPFRWNDGDLFLYGWCLKRIFDGPGDDIRAKYKVCVLLELKPKKKRR